MGKLPKPNNIVEVRTGVDTGFFKWWCTFLHPLINLTGRETDVMASFLKQRHELAKSITDPAILDRMVMSQETRRKVMRECGVTQEHFYVVMSNLRKSGVIVDGRINPRLIPNLRDDGSGYFQLLILFRT